MMPTYKTIGQFASREEWLRSDRVSNNAKRSFWNWYRKTQGNVEIVSEETGPLFDQVNDPDSYIQKDFF